MASRDWDTTDDMSDALADAKKARAIMFFQSFVKQAWKELTPNKKLHWGAHMTPLCRVLESVEKGETTRLVVAVPPRSGKSTFISVMFPAWQWLRRPSSEILAISGTPVVTRRDSRAMRDLLMTEWYQSLITYQHHVAGTPRWALARDNNQVLNFSTDQRGTRLCASAGGAVTGANADLMLLDDVLDARQALLGSEAQIQTRMAILREQYDGVWQSRLNSRLTSPVISVAQRLHPNDLQAYFIEDGWTRFIWHQTAPGPGEERHPEDHREPGEFLMPWSVNQAMKDKAMASERRRKIWMAQEEQSPEKTSAKMFDASHFAQRYEELPDVHQVVVSIDCAAKKGEKNDQTSYTVWGRKGASIYMIDRISKQHELPEQIREVLNFMHRFPTAHFVIESASNGIALIQMLGNMGHEKKITAMIPAALGGKETRAWFTIKEAENKNLFFPTDRAAPWMPTYVQQHLQFPSGSHDDDIDSTSQACAYFDGALSSPGERYAAMLKDLGGRG